MSKTEINEHWDKASKGQCQFYKKLHKENEMHYFENHSSVLDSKLALSNGLSNSIHSTWSLCIIGEYLPFANDLKRHVLHSANPLELCCKCWLRLNLWEVLWDCFDLRIRWPKSPATTRTRLHPDAPSTTTELLPPGCSCRSTTPTECNSLTKSKGFVSGIELLLII